ncbi:MAG: FHA domain-containing protein, partial [Candidatus Izemoplasmatales bacterium]|nr:FHA domain-containing protein [Candidatus Izemoplasmatales bacterium]
MLEIIIRQPGKKEIPGKLVPGIYRVGSGPMAHIHLPRPEISGQHAQFIVSDEQLKVIDLGSSNGTFVDGIRLQTGEAYETMPSSVIKIGEVEILIKGPLLSPVRTATPQPAPVKVNTPQPRNPTPAPQETRTRKALSLIISEAQADAKSKGENEIPILKISGIGDDVRPLVQEIKKRAHAELLKRLNLKRMAISGTSEETLAEKAKTTIHEILTELSIPLPPGVLIETIEKELVHEAIGLGPLEDLIGIEDITEIMVNGPTQVFVE